MFHACLSLFDQPAHCRAPHDWTQCIWAHDGEVARRRNPSTHSANPCVEYEKNGSCPRGQRCPYAHGVWERGLHPQRSLQASRLALVLFKEEDLACSDLLLACDFYVLSILIFSEYHFSTTSALPCVFLWQFFALFRRFKEACAYLPVCPVHRYRTSLCSKGDSCNRKICFFAHDPTQIRKGVSAHYYTSVGWNSHTSNSLKEEGQEKACEKQCEFKAGTPVRLAR